MEGVSVLLFNKASEAAGTDTDIEQAQRFYGRYKSTNCSL